MILEGVFRGTEPWRCSCGSEVVAGETRVLFGVMPSRSRVVSAFCPGCAAFVRPKPAGGGPMLAVVEGLDQPKVFRPRESGAGSEPRVAQG